MHNAFISEENVKVGVAFTQSNLAGKINGKYKGYAKYLEGNNRLGTNAASYEKFFLCEEAAVLINSISNREVNIRILVRGVPDFVFKNNFLLKDKDAEKILIEGDWLVEWGVIGWMDVVNEKLVIDINPLHYCQTPNSNISPELLINRYVKRMKME